VGGDIHLEKIRDYMSPPCSTPSLLHLMLQTHGIQTHEVALHKFTHITVRPSETWSSEQAKQQDKSDCAEVTRLSLLPWVAHLSVGSQIFYDKPKLLCCHQWHPKIWELIHIGLLTLW